MPFSARQTKTVALAYPDWPTQATEGEYFSETIQYSGNTIGSANGNPSPGWATYGAVFNSLYLDKTHTCLIRHPNGNIYGFPGNVAGGGSFNSGNIMIYDPSRGVPSATSITTSTPALKNILANNTFTGGMLGGNGNIYLPPGSANNRPRKISSANSNVILEYDPVNNTQRTISTGLIGDELFCGGFTDTTGNVFCTPWGYPGGFTKIDCSVEPVTITNNISFGYSKITDNMKFVGGTAHPNGKCYIYQAKVPIGAFPVANAETNITLLEIDTISETSVEIDTNHYKTGTPTNLCISHTLVGPDGLVYGLTYDAFISPTYNPYGGNASRAIIRCNPRTGNTTIVPRTTGGATTSDQQSGGIFAPNGILYVLPDISEDYVFYNVQTGTFTDRYSSNSTAWEFPVNDAMACDEGNVYVGAATNMGFGIIPINQSGGTNANAYTLSVYQQNST